MKPLIQLICVLSWGLLSVACGSAPGGQPLTQPTTAAASLASSSVPPADAALSVSSPAAPVANHFSYAALLPDVVTSLGAAATRDHLYWLGGYSGTPHHYVAEDQSDRFTRMNLHTGAVESLASSGRLQSASLSEWRGQLFRVGGLRIENRRGEPTRLRSVAEVAVFDPALGSWRELSALPEARSSHQAAFVGNKLFVVGGWKLDGDMGSGRWHDDMLVADVTESPLRWQSVPTPFKVRALGLAALDNALYALGGIVGRAERDATFVFDLASATWHAGPRLPEAGIGFSAASLEGAVYASGASGRVYRLQAGADAWTTVGELAFPRFFHQMVSQGNERILFVGGIPGDHHGARIAHVEALSVTPAASPWITWTVRSEVQGKNRQGLFLNGNQLYIFGGNRALGQHDFAPDNFLAEAFRLDLGSFAWKSLPPFPAARQSMVTASAEDDGFLALGGFGPEAGALRSFSDVFRFDLRGETWTPSAPLPEARTQFGLATTADEAWVFGGLNYDDRRPGKAAFVHPLSLLWGTRTEGGYALTVAQAQLPHERRAFAGAQLGSRYYIVGGMGDGFELVDGALVFDLTTRTWQSMPPPRATRLGAELVALGRRLYLVGGRVRGADGKLEFERAIEVFDTETGSWSVHAQRLPMTELAHLRVLAFRERLLMYSAQRQDGRVELSLLDPR